MRRQALQKDLATVEAALDRLAHAVAEGGTLSTLLSAIREHEDQRTRLCTELAMLDSLTLTSFDPVVVEHELRSYLKDWPSLAQAHPARARQILRKLLPNRIQVWREVRGGEKVYHYQGEAALGKLFNGLVNIERSGVPHGKGIVDTSSPIQTQETFSLQVVAGGWRNGCTGKPWTESSENRKRALSTGSLRAVLRR